ncbi:DTW domain-containing protein [Paraferrimonas sedimenticola]|uniref:tRNA-uridine aminocarboxypropyltransferase n=1 Tax=Paraferrimonas sedimenticola TaxID=375674 RepID=A0AA37S056_9GAMM|nr:DTW domain-containing protein [Paraferrimonas sedimenticola]
MRNQVKVVVLQHPSEAKAAKATVPLLELSLNDIQVVRGESPQDFNELREQLADSNAPVWLLYPSEDATTLVSAETPVQEGTLLVLDGTWKKAFKLYQLNPWLAELPQFALPSSQAQYRIRKAPNAEGLSTLEAVAQGLELVEHLPQTPLLHLLDVFIERQMQGMPDSVKQRY